MSPAHYWFAASALALAASGCDQAIAGHKQRLLSGNGSCYISGDLAEWLEGQKMAHVLDAPFHPQTQGKIERWHQTMKNHVLLKNYYLPGDLERQIKAFVAYYNNLRYHESLNNVAPADVYFGRNKAILRERGEVKKQTVRQRRWQHQKQTAQSISKTSQSLHCSNHHDAQLYMATDKTTLP